jgi:hypothetical protein
MAHRMTTQMAIAMAVAMLQNMAHSTPLHSTGWFGFSRWSVGQVPNPSYVTYGDWTWR